MTLLHICYVCVKIDAKKEAYTHANFPPNTRNIIFTFWDVFCTCLKHVQCINIVYNTNIWIVYILNISGLLTPCTSYTYLYDGNFIFRKPASSKVPPLCQAGRNAHCSYFASLPAFREGVLAKIWGLYADWPTAAPPRNAHPHRTEHT